MRSYIFVLIVVFICLWILQGCDSKDPNSNGANQETELSDSADRVTNALVGFDRVADSLVAEGFFKDRRAILRFNETLLRLEIHLDSTGMSQKNMEKLLQHAIRITKRLHQPFRKFGVLLERIDLEYSEANVYVYFLGVNLHEGDYTATFRQVIRKSDSKQL